MIEAKKNNIFEEIDEIKSVEVFESDNKAVFKSGGENLKNYRIYGQTVDGESVGDRTGNLFDGEVEQGSFIPETGIQRPTSKRLRTKFTDTPLPAGTYTINAIGMIYGSVYAYTDTDTGTFDASNSITDWTALPFQFTLDSSRSIRFSFCINDSVDIVPSDISNVMLNTGSTPLPYEPYGYKVPVTVEGKNLCNNIWEQGGIDGKTGDVTPAPNVVYCDFIPVKPNVTYSCSRTIGNNYNNLRCYGANKDYLGTGADLANKANPLIQRESFGTFMITDARVAYIRFNDLSNSLDTKYMLVEGAYTAETMPSYEPYQTPVTTNLYLPEQIKKVGDEAEYIDYGEQKQHRVRKNLLQNTATSQTINGVTFTVNSDGSVTCNGTASTTTFLTYSSNITISERAVLTGCPNDGGAFNYLIKIQKHSTSDTITNDTGVGSSEFYYADPIDVVIRIASGYTCNNLTFYPMIRKAEIEDDTYEPYIENTDLDVTLPALPTLAGTNVLSVNTNIKPSKVWGRISDPIDILYVKDNLGNILFSKYHEVEEEPPLTYKAKKAGTLTDYRIYGQTVDGESVGDRTGNLFDKNATNTENGFVDNAYFNGSTGEQVTNESWIISEYIDVEPNTRYCYSNSYIGSSPALCEYSENNTLLIVNKYLGGTSFTFTSSANTKKIRLSIRKDYINAAMLNSGSTALPYEPYGYKLPVTVEGKNLLQNTATSQTINGVTFTVNADGSVTCNGECVNNVAYYHIKNGFKFDDETKQYTLTGCPKGGARNSTYVLEYSNAVNGARTDSGNGVSFTPYSAADYPNAWVRIMIFVGYTCDNLTFYPMIRKADIEDDTYEPYHAPVTTPIYLPEQIKKVGDEAEYIDYGEQKQYIETTDGQEKYVVGLNVDFENKTFTRLADAVGLSKGADFDNFSAFGGRRRCNVADNGTITAYYGDANYTEDGSNGQVMVYQPAFYYKVEPLKIEAQESGVGYHLRNANYYISNHQGTGFKLHPAFYNEAGDRVDYILLGAYEGCIYDTSANTYITDDSQVMNSSEDKFSSIANVKPACGRTQNLTRPNLETICKNRGNGWHSLNIRIVSMEQLLMIIELGTMNTPTGAGSDGIISITGNSSYNCASLTGSTASLGNASGQAESTISDIGGAQTVETANRKTAYSFRGDENPWGNIWKFVYGVNIWGDGTMNGGVPYICTDFDFSESKNTDNYESAGFSVPNANGYVNALGYSENFDWLMMPSEIGGNASLPVGDYNYVTANLNGYKIARLGGSWDGGLYAGGVEWSLKDDVGYRGLSMGGRLVYIPQIEKQHIYTTDLDVTLPALPTLTGTNVLSVGTEVQPSEVYIKGKLKVIN